MNSDLKKREVYFRLHGQPDMVGRVRAGVFAKKLGELVRAAEAADRSTNSGKRHDLVISKLEAASASATMTEVRVSKKQTAGSGIGVLAMCAEAVTEGKFAVARKYPECVTQLRKLAHGSESIYAHGELIIDGHTPVRIDQFFYKQAEEAARPEDEQVHAPQWFKGMATGSFDGKILEVDLRGKLPKVKLVLTAGEKEIDCVCPSMDSEQLRNVLDRRVRLEGRAYYDGTSGIPARIEIMDITAVKEGADLRRWKGAFEPFMPEVWEGDA